MIYTIWFVESSPNLRISERNTMYASNPIQNMLLGIIDRGGYSWNSVKELDERLTNKFANPMEKGDLISLHHYGIAIIHNCILIYNHEQSVKPVGIAFPKKVILSKEYDSQTDNFEEKDFTEGIGSKKLKWLVENQFFLCDDLGKYGYFRMIQQKISEN